MLLTIRTREVVLDTHLRELLLDKNTSDLDYEIKLLLTIEHCLSNHIHLLVKYKSELRKTLYACAVDWGYSYAIRLLANPNNHESARHNAQLWSKAIDHFKLTLDELEKIIDLEEV